MTNIVVSVSVCCLLSTEEEYKRLSEALADEGTYTAVAFKYSADYYDPSQPTEEEEANREAGENTKHSQTGLSIRIQKTAFYW